jgi:hypothetical protein
VGPL